MKFSNWLPVPENEIPSEHLENLHRLFEKILRLEEAYGAELHASSAYRTLAHHQEIYALKNKKRVQAGLKPLSVPLGSQHLYGNAVDILDRDRKLGEWAKQNEELLKSFGIAAMEHLESCLQPVPWCHFQQVAVESGNFFFWP